LIANEFFEQGDLEKTQLKIVPMVRAMLFSTAKWDFFSYIKVKFQWDDDDDVCFVPDQHV
jgi:hypothetical protein